MPLSSLDADSEASPAPDLASGIGALSLGDLGPADDLSCHLSAASGQAQQQEAARSASGPAGRLASASRGEQSCAGVPADLGFDPKRLIESFAAE